MKIGMLAERVRLRMRLREYNRDDNPNVEPTATEAFLQASAFSRAREWQTKSAPSEPQFVIVKPSPPQTVKSRACADESRVTERRRPECGI